MSEITASICIRGWRRDTLPGAIESVLAQGRDDVEVIVGDDGGDIADVVASFDDPRVHYRRRDEPLTMSAHVRALLSETRGRYIGLLDDDDRMLPGYLDATIGRLDEDAAVGIAFTNYFYEAGGRLHERDSPVAAGRHDHFLPAVLAGFPINALSVALIRREVWEEGERRHPLRDDTFADMTMWIRAAQAGWPFHFVDERLVVYAMHPGQSVHNEPEMRDRAVRLWSSFRFDDAECERLRRRRLAEALLARANVNLRRWQLRAAGRDVRAARSASPAGFGGHELIALLGLLPGAARLLANHPRLVGPALAAWRRLRRFDRLD